MSKLKNIIIYYISSSHALNLLNDKLPLTKLFDIEENKLNFVVTDKIYYPQSFGTNTLYYLQDKKLSNKKILDLCSGSGIIGVGLAKIFPKATIVCSDINHEAFCVEQINCNINNLDNVSCVEGNLFDNINDKFDVIIATPPVLSKSQVAKSYPDLPEDMIQNYCGGQHGYETMNQILETAVNFLTDSGCIYIPVGKNDVAVQWVNKYKDIWNISSEPIQDEEMSKCTSCVLKLEAK